MSDADLQNKQGILLESGSNEMELLTVIVDDQPFGINVAKIQSIQQFYPDKVNKLPNAKKGIMGVLQYREKVVTLLDMAAILEIDVKNKYDKEIVVVTEFNNSVNAFRVQGVKRIYRLSWQDFVPLNQMMEQNAYVTGSVNIKGEEILVLDLEHILEEISPDYVLKDISEDVIEKQETISRDSVEIVFAEDSPSIRKGIVSRLKTAGFNNIRDFENGKLAHEYIFSTYRNSGRNLNNVVLISDIEMPQMDGLTLCRQVKSDPELKEIHVIMFSSLINDQMIAKCQSVKADNYVTKPETIELVSLIDQFIS